jgi:NAD(P)-dependent dehydrogenase (short-subunit alcohol dehydrogenase family)
MSNWTPQQLPDLSDKRIVVTGANSGIGREATREFARAGARVVMGCRNRDRADRAVADIREDVDEPDLVVESLDLGDLESIREFAQRVGQQEQAIDILVNNAGVMATPQRETEDGFELQFGVNHLGHFALTGHLLDAVRAGTWESRIVTISSLVHRRGEIDFDDLHGHHTYDKWDAYAQSKLANLLFAFELQRRLEAAGADTKSVAAHPGWAATNLQKRGPEMAGSRIRQLVMKGANALFAQDSTQGAWPTLYAATHEQIEGGQFVGPTGLLEARGEPGVVEPAEKARDKRTADRLWSVSEEETGVPIDLPEPTAQH